jgi:hypothetical protein
MLWTWQVLVDTGFKLTTGQVEALRPNGVALLGAVLRVFSGVEDPLLPGRPAGSAGKGLCRASTTLLPM